MKNKALDNSINFSKANMFAKNRIVLAPMTHNMSSTNGNLSAEEVKWLSKCIEGGFGTIITAATLVQKGGRCWQGQPSLISDYQQEQFTTIANVARKNNTLAIVQLHHGGVRAEPLLNSDKPVGPSAISPSDRYPKGVSQLCDKDIQQLIKSFVTAAKRAYKAGMHGIELHAAHNFLLCNFLNPTINQRNDKWGGSFDKRSRIILEIIHEVRRTVSRGFIIGVRLSPESYGSIEGIEWEHQVKVANTLANNDVDYIHFSMNDSFKTPGIELNSKNEIVASSEKKHTLLILIKAQLTSQVPLLVAGKVGDIDSAQKAIDHGADFVAIGTAALGNPDWVNSSFSDKKLLTTPFSINTLIKSGFNESGVNYLKTIDGLVG